MINHRMVSGLERSRCGRGLGVDVGSIIYGRTSWCWCCRGRCCRGCCCRWWWWLGCIVGLWWVARWWWWWYWWGLMGRMVSPTPAMGWVIIAISFSGCRIWCCCWWFIIPPCWWGVMARRHYYDYNVCDVNSNILYVRMGDFCDFLLLLWMMMMVIFYYFSI